MGKKRERKKDGTPKRGYGEGWLIKPGNGYRYYTAAWRTTIEVKDADGTTRRKSVIRKRSTETTDMDKAEEILDNIIRVVKARRVHDYALAEQTVIENERGDINAIRTGETTLSVGDAIEAIAEENIGIADNTREAYSSAMRGFCKWLGSTDEKPIRMNEIGLQTVIDYLEKKRMDGDLPITRKSIFMTLRGVFRAVAAVEDRIKNDRSANGHKIGATLPWPRLDLASDPWWTKPSKLQMTLIVRQDEVENMARMPRSPFTLEELHRVLEAEMDDEMRLFLRIGAQTGMRPGDAAQLKFGPTNQVRLDEGRTGRLYFTPVKTGRRSEAFVDTALGRELHDIIAKLPNARRDGEYLMPNIAALYKHDRSLLSRRVREVIEGAGFTTTADSKGTKRRSVYSYYSFRMTVARYSASADLSGAAAALGHSRPGSTTKLYVNGAKLEEDREAEAAAWERWYHSIDGKPRGTARGAFSIRAGEIDRADVNDAQKPVYDAVCAMLGGLEAETLKAVASEALRLAMAKSVIGAKAAS